MQDIHSFDLFIRFLTLLLFATRFLYWQITEMSAYKEKPKVKKTTLLQGAEKAATLLMGAFIGLQLIGIEVIPFEQNRMMQLTGFIVVILGFFISMLARKQLGDNWSHAAEYQIKKNQELVTKGIYKYIRHPIYSGMFLSAIGAELVVGSYLVIVFLLALPAFAYQQAKKEEKILTEKFSKKYNDYMHSSKMFLPGIW